MHNYAFVLLRSACCSCVTTSRYGRGNMTRGNDTGDLPGRGGGDSTTARNSTFVANEGGASTPESHSSGRGGAHHPLTAKFWYRFSAIFAKRSLHIINLKDDGLLRLRLFQMIHLVL
jgi:hypothetical protein